MCLSQTKHRHMAYSSAIAPIADIVSGNPIYVKPSAVKGNRHIVKHDYHDHAMDEPLAQRRKHVARGGVTTPFPVKLYDMLNQIQEDGFGHVVSWQPHGRCFVVHKPKEFVSHVMPTYFNQSKLASFQRQLNLYGFIRLTRGQDKGGYYHELFLRGKPDLCRSIQRIKVKGTGVRARSSPETEPDFYTMGAVDSEAASVVNQKETPVPQETTSSSSSAMMVTSVPQQQVLPNELDDVVMFEGKPFHYLDPFEEERLTAHQQPVSYNKYTIVSDDDEDPFSRNEMEDFLHDLNLSNELYDDIMHTVEDDEGLGQLLEKIIE